MPIQLVMAAAMSMIVTMSATVTAMGVVVTMMAVATAPSRRNRRENDQSQAANNDKGHNDFRSAHNVWCIANSEIGRTKYLAELLLMVFAFGKCRNNSNRQHSQHNKPHTTKDCQFNDSDSHHGQPR